MFDTIHAGVRKRDQTEESPARTTLYKGASNELDGMRDWAAASRAIAALPPGAVRDYLEAHEAEVVDMLLTEYDEEKTLQAEYYAGERAGLERGLQQGRLDALYDLVANGDLPISTAVKSAAAYGVTDETDFRRRISGDGLPREGSICLHREHGTLMCMVLSRHRYDIAKI